MRTRLLGLLFATPILVAAHPRAPAVSFRDDACPSFFAPRTCGGGLAVTCQEAFVARGPAAGCTTGHGDHANRFVPEDATADGGTSRAWSFRTRPFLRVFHSTWPEVTGSVRVTSDGKGAAGSVAGASDEAHLTIQGRATAKRVLVLRWFTGGLPAGASADVRVASGDTVLFHASEGVGPPARRTKVIPLRSRRNLDLTISGVVTAARDQDVPSADLLWHATVLPSAGDADHDGVPNRRDPDPLDATVPHAHRGVRRPKVLVLGVDAGGWDVVTPLVRAGYLPTIGPIVDGGVQALLDETPTESSPSLCCYCPPIWSSLITGQPASVHHMEDIPDEPWDRGAPSVSAVLSRHGGTVTHMSYRNTFPPEQGSRYNLTEEGLDVAGTELYRTNGFVVDQRSESMNRLQLTWPPLLFETMDLLPAPPPTLEAWQPLARDRVSATGLDRIAAHEQTDLTMWLLHSVDKTEHIMWTTVQPLITVPLDESTLLDQASKWTGPVYGGVWVFGDVASQYLEADLHLRELLDVAHYDYVMLVSDHSMTVNIDYPHPSVNGIHTLPQSYHGIFALMGPGVVPGRTLDTVSVLDVAPTIAYLLGLPVARNLPGRVVTEAFTPAHLAAHPIRTVPSW